MDKSKEICRNCTLKNCSKFLNPQDFKYPGPPRSNWERCRHFTCERGMEAIITKVTSELLRKRKLPKKLRFHSSEKTSDTRRIDTATGAIESKQGWFWFTTGQVFDIKRLLDSET